MEDLAIYTLLFAKSKKASFVYKPLYIYRTPPIPLCTLLQTSNLQSAIIWILLNIC